MSGLRTLGRQTVIYGLSGAAAQLVGLLTVPVVARVLTTSDYGLLELATVAVGLISLVADAGLASAGQRSFFDYTGEQPAERKLVLSTTLISMTTSAVALAVVSVLLREPIARLLFGSSHQSTLVLWMAASLLTAQLAVFAREVLRLHFWATAYLWSSIIAALLGGAVSVIGVLVFDGGVQAVLAGGVVGATASTIYGLIRGRSVLGPQFSRFELRRMLAYGIPLVPAALSIWALAFIDRLLLQHFGSLSQVGEYAMANRLASVLMLAVTAFGIAFSPFALDLHLRDPQHERAIRAQALTALVAILAVLSLFVSVFAREAISVLAPKFDAATDTVGLLCLGTLLFGVASTVMLEISLARRTRIFAIYSTIGAVVNIALNIALIGPLGIVGAGIATVVAFLILAGGYWYHAQAIAHTPYETKLVVELIVAGTIIGAAGLLPLGLGYFAIKLLAVAAFTGLLVARGLLRPRVLRMILDATGVRVPARFAGRPPSDDGG